MNSMSDVEFARRCNDADLDAFYEHLWYGLSDRHDDLVIDVSSEIARQIIEDYNIS